MRADGKPCLIYGCANHAELVCNYLYQHGLEVEAYVVDKKYWKQDFYIGEKCVKKLEDYLEILDVYKLMNGMRSISGRIGICCLLFGGICQMNCQKE